MLLGIGTRVKFLSTPDSGVIVDKLGDGMVMVQLDGVNMEIPAFEEDLVREEDWSESNFKQVDLKNKKGETIQLIEEKIIHSTFTNKGISIALLPFKKTNDEIDRFDILLLNDTIYDVLYECDFIILNETEWSKDGKIAAVGFEKIGEMFFDDINDAPEFDVTISPIYTEGVGNKLTKTLKIKAKQFIKSFHFSDFLERDVYEFTLFEKFETDDKTQNSDLQKYTESLVKDLKKKTAELEKKNKILNPAVNINEYASFIPEIDLHIELLYDNPKTLTNEEIIMVQLRAFEHFLSKAIRLNVKRVYVIHGVGKGKLRDMIHAQLRRHGDVDYFKNEYHERYGWGATEILL
jgi:Smr domain